MKYRGVAVDGDPVHVELGGSGFRPDRETLVLVHGAGASHTSWRDQLDGLDGPLNVVAPDLLGHGLSGGRVPETIGEYARWIARLTRAMEMPPFYLLGHSMGGGIVLEAALDPPEGLKGIVLSSTGARLPVNRKFLESIVENFDETVQLVSRYCFTKEAPQELRERLMAEMKSCPPEVVRVDFEACDAFDVQDRLDRIQCPTLILHGNQDVMTPTKYADIMRDGIKGSKVVFIEPAGHMPMMEQPEAYNAAILDFIRQNP